MDDSLEARLRAKQTEHAELKAAAARIANPGLGALAAAAEVEVADLKRQLEARRTPEARLQACLSRLAATTKEQEAAAEETARLKEEYTKAEENAHGLAAKMQQLRAEVEALKADTASSQPPPAAASLPWQGIQTQLAARGMQLDMETLQAAILAALVPPPQATVGFQPEGTRAAEGGNTPASDPSLDGDAAMQTSPPGFPQGEKRPAETLRTASLPPPMREQNTLLASAAGPRGSGGTV